jgi:hypothetical protein
MLFWIGIRYLRTPPPRRNVDREETDRKKVKGYGR